MKAKVIAHPAKGAVTVETEEHGQFNAVTAFDSDPPKIGSEIEVDVISTGGRILQEKDGSSKAANVVEYAVHVRDKKK